MINENETITAFVKEALAHLDDVEADLKDLKGQGEPFDPGLCSNVHRHMNTVKGAAGFYQFETIKTLAGKMAQLMSRTRYQTVTVNKGMLDAVLAGAGALKKMFGHVSLSDQVDIRDELALLDRYLGSKEGKENTVAIQDVVRCGRDAMVFDVPEKKIKFLLEQGHSFYTLEFLLKEDLEEKNVKPYNLINAINWNGELLESRLDIDRVTGLSDCLETDLPCIILFASRVEPDSIPDALGLPVERISTIDTFELAQKLGIVKEDPDTLYLIPDSDLVASQIEVIRDTFLKQIRSRPGVSTVVLKADQVKNMDSLGVNLVIGIYRQVTAESKAFKVTGAGERFLKIAKFFQFPALFKIEAKE